MANTPIYDVIIVGGGLAGLTAAHHLTTSAQKRVCLLESQANLGGRLKTIYSPEGVAIDVGAMLLNGPGTKERPNPLYGLLKRFSLKTLVVDPLEAACVDTQGQPISLKTLYPRLKDGFETAIRRVQEAKKLVSLGFPALSEVLDYRDDNIPLRDSEAYWIRKLVTASTMHNTGAKLDQISLLELMQQGRYSGPTEIVVGGYQQLIDKLYAETQSTGLFDLYCNTRVVTFLHEETTSPGVMTEQGQHFKAKAVLSALPLNVVKDNRMKFIPPLSKEKSEALKHHQMGYQNRVILRFKEMFWDNSAHYLYPNDPNINYWPEYLNLARFSEKKPPYLVANFYADRAAQFKYKSDAEILALALQPLKRVFGDKVSALSWSYITRWETDTNSLGAGSYCHLGASSLDLEYISSPETNGLYFGSEYTRADLHNTVEGAYESGLEAALQMRVYLDHQSEITHPSFGSRHRLR